MSRRPFSDLITPEHYRMAFELARVGLDMERAALIMFGDDAPSAKTFSQYFQKEWEKGRKQGDGEIAKTLFSMATSGKNPATSIFLAKVRLGWKETQNIEVTKKIDFITALKQVNGSTNQPTLIENKPTYDRAEFNAQDSEEEGAPNKDRTN